MVRSRPAGAWKGTVRARAPRPLFRRSMDHNHHCCPRLPLRPAQQQQQMPSLLSGPPLPSPAPLQLPWGLNLPEWHTGSASSPRYRLRQQRSFEPASLSLFVYCHKLLQRSYSTSKLQRSYSTSKFPSARSSFPQSQLSVLPSHVIHCN